VKRLPHLIASFGLAIALAGAAHAQTVQGLDGDWTGKLEIQGVTLTIVFHVRTVDGKTTATMDSPDQGAVGLEVSNLKREGQKVRLEVPIAEGLYEATLAADGKSISGTWSQPRPLVMTKN